MTIPLPPQDTSEIQLPLFTTVLQNERSPVNFKKNAFCEQTRCTCNLAKLQVSLQTCHAQTLQRIRKRSILTDACKNPRFLSKFSAIGFGLSPGERGYSLI